MSNPWFPCLVHRVRKVKAAGIFVAPSHQAGEDVRPSLVFHEAVQCFSLLVLAALSQHNFYYLLVSLTFLSWAVNVNFPLDLRDCEQHRKIATVWFRLDMYFLHRLYSRRPRGW